MKQCTFRAASFRLSPIYFSPGNEVRCLKLPIEFMWARGYAQHVVKKCGQNVILVFDKLLVGIRGRATVERRSP